VIKQGVIALCFHPHGWINNTQIVELIDHAVSRYGRKVKFLSLRDVQARLDKNLLAGQPYADPRGTTTACGCATSTTTAIWT